MAIVEEMEAVMTQRMYCDAALLLDMSTRCGRDMEKRIRLERAADRRLTTAKADTAAAGTREVWHLTDRHAALGEHRMTQLHAKDAVARINGGTT